MNANVIVVEIVLSQLAGAPWKGCRKHQVAVVGILIIV